MAIKNLVSSSYNYGSESYSSNHLNWSLEDEAENKASADMAVIDAESEVDSAEHAANAADAMSGVLEVAESSGGEVTENEASLIDDVNTAVAGDSGDPEEAPIVVSSESNGRYYISKEGIVDKIKEIWKRIKEAIMRVWDKLKDAYKKYFGTYKAMQKRAEKIKKRAEDMSGKSIDEKTIDYENNISMLYIGADKLTDTTGLMRGLKICEETADIKAVNVFVKTGDSFTEIISSYDGDNSNDSRLNKMADDILNEITDPKYKDQKETPFLGAKKIYKEREDADLNKVGGSWESTLKFEFSSKLRLDDFSNAKLSDKITFKTMTTSEVEKVCDKVIEIAKLCVTLTSSNGIDKLMIKKDKIKDASDKLEKRYQSALKDNEHDSGLNGKYTTLLKLNTYYASMVTLFSRTVQICGTFMGTCLTLSEKSLSNHKTK